MTNYTCSISDSLAKSVDKRIEARLPNMPTEFEFTVKSLLGSDFWSQIGVSQWSNVGKYFSYLVNSGALDLICINPETGGTKIYIKE